MGHRLTIIRMLTPLAAAAALTVVIALAQKPATGQAPEPQAPTILQGTVISLSELLTAPTIEQPMPPQPRQSEPVPPKLVNADAVGPFAIRVQSVAPPLQSVAGQGAAEVPMATLYLLIHDDTDESKALLRQAGQYVGRTVTITGQTFSREGLSGVVPQRIESGATSSSNGQASPSPYDDEGRPQAGGKAAAPAGRGPAPP